MSGQLTSSLDDTTSLGGLLHDVRLDYYGRKAASASADNTVRIWDVADGQLRPAQELKGGHEGPVWKVSWAHPKFGSIIASCGYDMKVIVWKEVHNQWQIAYADSSHAASVNDVEFCPWEHGLQLACASSDGTVSILSYQYDGSWRRTAFPANAGGVQALSWSPVQYRDGQPLQSMRLVTGGCDNCVSIWKCEGEAWSPEAAPLAHADWVRDVAWRPDGSGCVASGSWDMSVVIWKQEMEGQPWRQACKLTLPGKVESLSWSATGSILAVSCGESEAVLYKEAYDGKFEEVGKVNEPGFVEVPSSFSAGAPPVSMSPNQPPPEEAPTKLSAELQEQQQAVLDSFGM